MNTDVFCIKEIFGSYCCCFFFSSKSFYTAVLMATAWKNISNSSLSSISFFSALQLVIHSGLLFVFQCFFLAFSSLELYSRFSFNQPVQSFLSSFSLSWWSNKILNLIFPCSVNPNSYHNLSILHISIFICIKLRIRKNGSICKLSVDEESPEEVAGSFGSISPG